MPIRLRYDDKEFTQVAHMNTPMLTIGAVSQATGIPVNTLRTWERRYNFPPSDRSPGRQRLYSPEIIFHLRLINKALDKGLRPRQIMGLSHEELSSILGETTTQEDLNDNKEIAEWLEAAQNLDGLALDKGFKSALSHLGLQNFIIDRVCPFLELIGRSWSEGSIEIFQEHFASQRINDFLTSCWRSLSDTAQGKTVVCAALPGEHHYLGLQMAAAIMALNGFKIIFIGPHTPLTDIQACAWQSQAYAILLSCSITTSNKDLHPMLVELRRLLPPSTKMLIGGSGSPANISNIACSQLPTPCF